MGERRTLAIANRGEIAVRIARTARALGWQPVVLLSPEDGDSYAAREIANVAVLPPAGEFSPRAVIQAALGAGATALHPGYGFLSERPELSRGCDEAGICFVGPRPETLEVCGHKIATRQVARDLGVPILHGSPELDLDALDSWARVASEIGYPVMAKIAGAGGGRGLRVARSAEDLAQAVRSALNEAGGSGAELSIYLERYLEGARHVEIQTVGDGERAIAIGDRDCSLQRRHQKVIEEAPAPGIDAEARTRLWDAAARLATAVGLRSLATVEFLMDQGGGFYFMEINPRLQVEHTVTEEVTGLDLVAVQLDLACGGTLPELVEPTGHAIQARLYAEDPFNQFLPDPGTISLLEFPDLAKVDGEARLRIDQGYESGDRIPASFDSLIAKVVVHAPDRVGAVEGLAVALRRARLAGIHTNRPWLVDLLESEAFRSNNHDVATTGEIVSEPRPPEPDELGAAAGAVINAQAGPSAWETSGPFRIVSPARLVFHGDEAGGWQGAVEVTSRSGGWMAEDEAGQDDGVVAVEVDDGYEITSAGGRWLARVGPRAAKASRNRQADGVIVAPMPGKVLAVEIAEGERVTEGQVVAVLEAMKIEISLSAPFDGQVAGVQVQAGDLVGTRQPIMTILPDESEANA